MQKHTVTYLILLTLVLLFLFGIQISLVGVPQNDGSTIIDGSTISEGWTISDDWTISPEWTIGGG